MCVRNVLQCVAARCSVLQCIACVSGICCSVLQRVAVCCSVLHVCQEYVWHDSCMCVTWPIHMCDMTHSYVWHDPFICVTWLIHMSRDSFISVYIWLYLYVYFHMYIWLNMYVYTYMYTVTRASVSRVSCHTYEWVMSHIWASHVTHMSESCHVLWRICMSNS